MLLPLTAGLFVGAAITVAGRSFLQMLIGSGGTELTLWELALIFPFPIWGPLLAAASIAYYHRVRASARFGDRLTTLGH